MRWWWRRRRRAEPVTSPLAYADEPTEVLWGELPTEQIEVWWRDAPTEDFRAFRVPPYVQHLKPAPRDDDAGLTWPDLRRDMWR